MCWPVCLIRQKYGCARTQISVVHLKVCLVIGCEPAGHAQVRSVGRVSAEWVQTQRAVSIIVGWRHHRLIVNAVPGGDIHIPSAVESGGSAAAPDAAIGSAVDSGYSV